MHSGLAQYSKMPINEDFVDQRQIRKSSHLVAGYAQYFMHFMQYGEFIVFNFVLAYYT